MAWESYIWGEEATDKWNCLSNPDKTLKALKMIPTSHKTKIPLRKHIEWKRTYVPFKNAIVVREMAIGVKLFPQSEPDNYRHTLSRAAPDKWTSHKKFFENL